MHSVSRSGTLSERLSTPLQFECYLTRAFEETYKVGQKAVGANMIENVFAKDERKISRFIERSHVGVQCAMRLARGNLRD